MTPGNIQGQVGCGSGQAGAAEDAPAPCSRVDEMGFKDPFQPKSFHAFNPQGTSGSHPISQTRREPNQPPTSVDILKAVNKINPQQGQREQTVRDVGSRIIHTENVITNRQKEILPSLSCLSYPSCSSRHQRCLKHSSHAILALIFYIYIYFF